MLVGTHTTCIGGERKPAERTLELARFEWRPMLASGPCPPSHARRDVLDAVATIIDFEATRCACFSRARDGTEWRSSIRIENDNRPRRFRGSQLVAASDLPPRVRMVLHDAFFLFFHGIIPLKNRP